MATFSNLGSITINDSGSPPTPATPYPSTVDVAGVVGTVRKVTLTLNGLSHTFPHDIDILLVGPTGMGAVLWSAVGDGSPVVDITVTLDDDAASFLPILLQGPLVAGTFKPLVDRYLSGRDTFPAPAPSSLAPPLTLGSLSAFAGKNPNGTWSLYVVDVETGDSGSISGGWSLTIETAALPLPALFDHCHYACSFSGTAKSYGESISQQWAISSLNPLMATGDYFQFQVLGTEVSPDGIPQMTVGVVTDYTIDLPTAGVWSDTAVNVPFGETIIDAVPAYFDHPDAGDEEYPYDLTDVFKIVREDNGLSYYRNNNFLDFRAAGSSPDLPDPMPPLYIAFLGAFSVNPGPSILSNGLIASVSSSGATAVWTMPPIRWRATGTVTGPPVFEGTTQRFDAGLGSKYWLLSQITDSGNELRSKTIKSCRVTSKRTNSAIRVYPFDVEQQIDIPSMEDDIRTAGSTNSLSLTDSENVSQSARKQINVKNAVLSAVRVSGDDRGQVVRDRIDEVVLEQAIQGARR